MERGNHGRGWNVIISEKSKNFTRLDNVRIYDGRLGNRTQKKLPLREARSLKSPFIFKFLPQLLN